MPDDRPVNPIPPADLDTLSAYLDDQLPAAERAALEARLSDEPDLRAELESLRAVKLALASLPPLRAPRNLTLTAAQARPARRVAAFPAFVSGLSTVAAAILLIAGFLALRPVSAPALTNAVAAAPTATDTTPQPASPAARAIETILPVPQESAGDSAGFTDQTGTVQELFAATDMTEPPAADAMLAAPSPGEAEQQDAAAAESMLAGSAPAAGNAAEAAPTGMAELAMQAPMATSGTDSTRTKEATPTPLPSETPVPTLTPSATPSPTVTASPSPTPAPVTVPETAAQASGEPPPVLGWALLALGGMLLAVAVIAGRRARRGR